MMKSYAPVQCSGYNVPPDDAKSDTELIRQVAENKGWMIHEERGDLVDSTGAPIGPNLETLAAAAAELGWFQRDPRGKVTLGINWGAVNTDRLRGQIARHKGRLWQDWQ